MGGVREVRDDPQAETSPTSMGTSRNGRCEPQVFLNPSLTKSLATSMGTSRNGRCEQPTGAHDSYPAGALQWGPPGMGGVS